MKSKVCSSCGRSFDFRKKWKDNWQDVLYCSSACSRLKAPLELMDKVMSFVAERGCGKTICPSEVLLPVDKKNKLKMERVRCAARLLAHKGQILITQKNKVVDPDNFKGPIRLKLKK